MSGQNLPAGTLAAVMAERTGISPLSCYQCGRCAAGCFQNLPGEMDVSPTRIMHLLKMEVAFAGEPPGADYARRALTADTCWLCAGCLACTTRCPQGVDIAGTMDVLRQEGLARGLTSRTRRSRDIQAFHRVFLGAALGRGRLHELFMMIAYKLRTGHLLADATLGPAMLRKRKLRLLPGKAPGAGRVRAAVEKMKQQERG